MEKFTKITTFRFTFTLVQDCNFSNDNEWYQSILESEKCNASRAEQNQINFTPQVLIRDWQHSWSFMKTIKLGMFYALGDFRVKVLHPRAISIDLFTSFSLRWMTSVGVVVPRAGQSTTYLTPCLILRCLVITRKKKSPEDSGGDWVVHRIWEKE